MDKIMNPWLKEPHLRWIGIISISLLFPFMVDIKNDVPFYQKWGTAFVFTALSWNGAASIMGYFRQRYKGYYGLSRYILYSLIFITLYIIVLNTLAASAVDWTVFSCKMAWSERLRITTMALSFTLSVAGTYMSFHIYEHLQESMLEAQRFQTEHIKSQFEVLKNQIDPHFLFNSLNTLASIITENQQIAVSFAEKLSQVYRYILQNKDKEVVDLATEVDFAKSYIFLLQTRFEKNLTVHFELNEHYLNRQIPPLSLQILVENAVKHNIVSNEKPLHIDIYVGNEAYIMVRNNLQLKRNVKNSNKIGLDNIIKRYAYLTEQNVEVFNSAQEFRVSLPLLSLA